MVGAFWFPQDCEIRELRGRTLTTVAATAPENAAAMTIEWLEGCTYPPGRRRVLEAATRRYHASLRSYRNQERTCPG
jgi:hypothetical protein